MSRSGGRRLAELAILSLAAVLFQALLVLPLAGPATEAPGTGPTVLDGPAWLPAEPEPGTEAGSGAAAETGVSVPPGQPPFWLLPLDDSYIFIRYAQQLARGLPFQWNEGEPSTGASSFLVPWLLLPGQWLGDEGDLQVWSRWSRAIGTASLFLAGFAAALFVRRIGLSGPWPVTAGVAVLASGPLSIGAVAGMESGLNAAALLAAAAFWIGPFPSGGSTGRSRSELVVGSVILALLPWIRPENGALTALAVGLIFLRRGPGGLSRWAAPLLLVPGAVLAGIDLLLTGQLTPAGTTVKSVLGIPGLPPSLVVDQWLATAGKQLVPVYFGAQPTFLPLTVGLGCLATVAFTLVHLWLRRRGPLGPRAESWSRLPPLVVAWGVLCLLSPFSTSLLWQGMRHHHGALACAWVLAIAGLGLWVTRLGERLPPRARLAWLGALLPLLVLTSRLDAWPAVYSSWVRGIHHRHGPAVAWLETRASIDAANDAANPAVLLLNDAGWLALAHDGPMIDLVGLGSKGLARPYRTGPGSLVEALARRDPLPEIAALNMDLVPIPELFGPDLIPGLDPATQTVIRPVRRQLLAETVIRDGLDFTVLEDEARAGLLWRPRPITERGSLAVVRETGEGSPRIQGCRPLLGRLGIPTRSLAAADGGQMLRWTALTGEPTIALFRGRPGDGEGEGEALGRLAIRSGRAWAESALPEISPEASVGARDDVLWLERQGEGLACLEALLPVGGPPR